MWYYLSEVNEFIATDRQYGSIIADIRLSMSRSSVEWVIDIDVTDLVGVALMLIVHPCKLLNESPGKDSTDGGVAVSIAVCMCTTVFLDCHS